MVCIIWVELLNIMERKVDMLILIVMPLYRRISEFQVVDILVYVIIGGEI